MKFKSHPVMFKRTPDTPLPWDCANNQPEMKEYTIVAYKGPDMENHISQLKERMVVATEQILRALARGRGGEADSDSADSDVIHESDSDIDSDE
jgi:hypothetical protein